MSSCERMSGCPFFNGKIGQDMPSVAKTLKAKYCMNNKEECARYMLLKSGLAVPDDMFPNDIERAKTILKG